MKTKFLTLAILASLVATGCSKDETTEQPSSFPADGVIRIATSIEGLKTRAGATTDNLTKIGFCVTNGSNSTYSYSNIEMTKSSGVWSSASMMLWQNATQAVDIVAYSPYQDAVEYTTTTADAQMNVQADQSATDESGIIASDFLAVREASFVPHTDLVDGKISLSLSHLMSKLNLTITLGTEFNVVGTATNPITDIKIGGTKLKGVFSFSTMTMSVASVGNDATAVNPFTGAYTAGDADTKGAIANYECIFVPQTVNANDFTVNFKINGKPYEWVSDAAVTLTDGMKYNLNLTAGKDFVKMGEFGSSEWIEGTGGDLETE